MAFLHQCVVNHALSLVSCCPGFGWVPARLYLVLTKTLIGSTECWVITVSEQRKGKGKENLLFIHIFGKANVRYQFQVLGDFVCVCFMLWGVSADSLGAQYLHLDYIWCKCMTEEWGSMHKIRYAQNKGVEILFLHLAEVYTS